MSAEEPWVEVVPYDFRWAAQFENEASSIGAVLGDIAIRIEHFGSTSVPGMAAKPIVDVLVGVQGVAEPTAVIDALQGLDYEYLGADGRRPGRYFWRKRGADAFNVSVVPLQGTLWESNIAIREFLRAHPVWVRRYAAVKYDAARAGQTSMLAYQNHKREFVDDLRIAALVWYRH